MQLPDCLWVWMTLDHLSSVAIDIKRDPLIFASEVQEVQYNT